MCVCRVRMGGKGAFPSQRPAGRGCKSVSNQNRNLRSKLSKTRGVPSSSGGASCIAPAVRRALVSGHGGPERPTTWAERPLGHRARPLAPRFTSSRGTAPRPPESAPLRTRPPSRCCAAHLAEEAFRRGPGTQARGAPWEQARAEVASPLLPDSAGKAWVGPRVLHELPPWTAALRAAAGNPVVLTSIKEIMKASLAR